MDVGRTHYLLAAGFMGHVLKDRLFPVLVEVEVQYKRGLKPGQACVLETRLVEVRGKASVLQQTFWRGDEVVADARVVCLFLQRGKPVDLEQLIPTFVNGPAVLAAMGEPLRQPVVAS
jgi:acyl-CoA thioesterase FadM